MSEVKAEPGTDADMAPRGRHKFRSFEFHFSFVLLFTLLIKVLLNSLVTFLAEVEFFDTFKTPSLPELFIG